ncbi:MULTISPECIES: hypothetical protein [unclassified Rhizobium]|uniref:hypothetical protein n=1 Tax=unclassified Rhizobium TaxID=2613769 RepID=UPI001AE1133F|nr:MULTISPECIES: hypothetical protein [unclassified Rhizobium]MBP2460474.1 hypothetical protein [Rhizobium sp. PvP014]MBP2527871.1 hypothetical protein [Rhizobium sp. PvP099]
MRSLTDFIKMLPGVKPRKTRSLILDGDLLSTAEKRDIFYRGDGIFDTVQVVGPDAAVAILLAYRENRLPMDQGENVREAPEAERYLEQSDTLRTQIAERRRRDACVKDISLVEERDFLDNRLLDRIFWANAPKGKGTLTLAGIAVTKTFHGYSSNSGKSTGYEVTFHWVGSDGEARSSGTGKPPEADNRRNDEDRNWGLHE